MDLNKNNEEQQPTLNVSSNTVQVNTGIAESCVTRGTNIRRNKNIENGMRQLICRKYDAGQPITCISGDLEINYKTVSSIISIYKQSGRTDSNMKNSGKKKIFTSTVTERIKKIVDTDCSKTLKQIKTLLAEEMSLHVSTSTINRAIDDFQYSFKRVVLIPEARNNESNIQKRYDYARMMITQNLDDLIFIDEFGVNCSMRQRYGRSAIGIPAKKVVTTIRSKNISVCAAVSRNGLLNFKISETSFNTGIFIEFVRELIETLRVQNMPNKTLILDNAAIHKNNAIKDLIEDNGHQLVFLPPYTPQLNPIEEVFSLWKEKIRAENCISKSLLLSSIQNKHVEITSNHCLAFYRHMQHFLGKAIDREEF